MITETITQLREIGLTEGEIKIYDALLRCGEMTKTRLALESGVSPANLYDITNRLSEKGIISIVERNGVKNFSASNPRHLLDFLNHKKESIKKEERLITQMLPALDAAYKNQSERTRTESFSGWNGLRTVFEDMLTECTENDENIVYGASVGENTSQSDRFFLKYSMMRSRKGIPLRIIFNENVRKRKERIEFFMKSKKCAVRFLEQTTASEIMIYKNTAIILILTQEPMAIRIREKGVADSFRQHFDLMWKIARP